MRPLLSAFVLAALPLSAAPDTVDPTFAASAGQVFDAGSYGGVASVLVQPDGKILFGSNEMPGTVGGSPLQLPLIRFNPDGTVDNTFFADNDPNGSGAGIYYDLAGWPEVHALGLDSAGKIIAAGAMQGMRDGTHSLASNSIVRIHPDGTLDASFQTAGTTPWPTGSYNFIEDVTVQPDDKVIAVGGFGGIKDSPTSVIAPRYGIARFNTDGSVDTGFTIDPAQFPIPGGVPKLAGFFRQAALGATGKIYVIGEFSWGNSYPRETLPVLARLYPNGRRDFSFSPVVPPGVTQLVGCVVEPSGKVVLLGDTDSGGSWMARFEADGTPDPSFVLDASLGRVTARPLQVDPNGNYLLATAGSAAQNRLIRIHGDGSLDLSFSAEATFTGGFAGTGYIGTFTTAPSGKIYTGSFFDTVNGVNTHKVAAFEGDAVTGSPGTIQFAGHAFSATEEAGTVRIAIARSGGTAGVASATFSANPFTASAADFTSTPVTVTFPDGVGGTQYVEIAIAADALVEPTEIAHLTLSGFSGAAAGAITAAELSILDSNSAPQIILQPQTLYVPPSGGFMLTVGVLSGAEPTTYQWFKNGALIPGATSPLYFVAHAEAGLHDGSYTVAVTNPRGTTNSAAAMVTVKDPAILSFGSATYSALEDAGSLSLTLTRTGSTVGAVSVDVITTSGSAGGADFTPATTTVSWGNGDSSNKTVVVPLANDVLVEAPETFTATLANFSADATPGAIVSATATILDDDAPLVITQQPQSVTATEGAAVAFTVVAESQSPLSYAWFFNGGPLGATGSTYSIAAAAPSHSGSYTVEITNSAGTVTSTTAILYVAPGAALVAPGFSSTASFSDTVRDIDVLPDGSAVVAGDFVIPGQYLQGFDASGAATSILYADPDGPVKAIDHLSDGSIVIAGSFTTVGGTSCRSVALLDGATGELDATFAANVGATFNNTANDIAVLPDDRIVVGGTFSSPGSGYLVVLNPDGSLDTSFSPTLTTAWLGNPYVNGVDVTADGKILATGAFATQGATSIVRLNADGSRDAGFSSAVVPFNGYGYDATALADGRVALALRTPSSGGFYLLAEDGTTLRNVTSAANTLAIAEAADGKLISVGDFTGGIDRWTGSGDLDNSFRSAAGSRLNGPAYAIAIDPAGRLWIGGNFSDFNGSARSRLVVLNGDLIEPAISAQPQAQIVDPGSTVDFQVGVFSARPVTYQWLKDGLPLSNGSGFSGVTTAHLTLHPAALAEEGDYSVVVSTAFFSVESEPAALLVNDAPRILAEPGASTVSAGNSLTLEAEVIALEPATYVWTKDGTEVGTGPSLVLDPVQLADEGTYQLTVTNDLGSAHTTPVFIEVIPAPGGLAPPYASLVSASAPSDILPLPDGRTLIAVQNAPNDAAGSNTGLRLFVIKPDGHVDDAFNFSFIGGNIDLLHRQPDGKILIAGSFATINGQPYNRIARLNADLTLDPGFQAGGPGSGQSVQSFAVDGGGRIYAAGSFSAWGGETQYSYLVRLLEDGSLDRGYQPGMGYYPRQIELLADGRLLVGGTMTSPIYRIGALFPDGSKDIAVSINLPGNFGAFAVDEDHVYVGYQTGIRRFSLTDGSWDQSFSPLQSPTSGSFTDLLLQTNGKLLAAGSFSASNGAVKPYLLRYLPNGLLDPTFDLGSGLNNSVSTAALDGQGRIWLSTAATALDGATLPGRLVVLNGDEVPLDILADPSDLAVEPGQPARFTVSATGTSQLHYQWLKNGTPLADSGRISGSSTATLDFAFTAPNDGGFYSVEVRNEAGVRVSAAAELYLLAAPEILDPPVEAATEVGLGATFRVHGRGVSPLGYQWFLGGAPLSDGPGVSGATTDTLELSDLEIADSGPVFVRLTNPLGTIDSDPVALLVEKLPASIDRSIHLPLSVNSTIYDVLPLDDGGYVIGGFFGTISYPGGSASRRYLARFHADGSPDLSFPQVDGSGQVNVLAADAGGRIYVGGAFTSLSTAGGTVPASRLVRLHADGSIDGDFDPGSGPNGTVEAILPLAGGKVLVAGAFTSIDGRANTAYVARLNGDGSVDETFVSQAVFTIKDVAEDGGGGYWLSHPNSYDGQSRLVRVTATGAKAAGFSYSGSMTSYGLIANPDGSACSLSTSYPYLQRLEADGSLAAGWPNAPSGPAGAVTAGIRTAGGRLIISGNFSSFGGATASGLAALEDDGSLVSGFDSRSGLPSGAEAIRTDAAGRLWVVGNFTSYQGEAVPRLVVLNGFGNAGSGTPFEDFVSALPASEQGENADPDGDGFPNLVEFALDLDPAVPSSPLLTSAFRTGPEIFGGLYDLKTYMVLEIETPKDLHGTHLEFEASRDLSFSDDATATEILPRTDHGHSETRRYYLTPALEDASTLFWRLSATR
ncbi:immunoglobulin domain-containing protein [Haloferula sargassicola]|uniref:Ig-like domain-containing protein n=1 Tax=Haloferula sargassicola TaxID=490096 RepID=A0ABP9UMJ3_9BACT